MTNVKDQRNPSLMIRISPELNDRLDRVAEMYGVTRGEVARMAIGQYVGQVTGGMGAKEPIDYERIADLMVCELIEGLKILKNETKHSSPTLEQLKAEIFRREKLGRVEEIRHNG